MNDKWVETIKWFISSVCIVVVTLIIDSGFRDREAGIEEMKVYDKYVDIILKADNIEQRWKLCEYFSIVTPTERLRKRWIAYKDTISKDYYRWKSLQVKDSSEFPQQELNDKPLMTNEQSNFTRANFYEGEGFESLLNKDVKGAILYFRSSEDSKPGYHNCWEIYNFLKKNERNLAKPESLIWQELYSKLVTDWSWGMTQEIKLRLKIASKNIQNN